MARLGFPQRIKNFRSVVRFAWRAISSTSNPLLAQMVVTRRCNLSCGYCNEYDDVSAPVPTQVLLDQVAHLAGLGTAAVTCTGGEPLLHPELVQVIRSIRKHGMISTMITNGFRLNQDRIESLNNAGLQEMQISIDNLVADDISMKSLGAVDQKLELLARHADFKVNINTVLGVTPERTDDALQVATRAEELGFFHTVGVLHDEQGNIEPLSGRQYAVYRDIRGMSKSAIHSLNYWLYQRNLIEGKPNNWKCRAGARYLYICEEGRVHWCSQKRGYPGTLLMEYTKQDIRREFDTQKDCSPYCALSCVHQMSAVDRWRRPQSRSDPHTPTVQQISSELQ